MAITLMTPEASIFCRLTAQEPGFKLEIWECPSGNAHDSDSVLFRVNYTLPTAAAAYEVLAQHLQDNGFSANPVPLAADGAVSPLNCCSIVATLGND
jgi:hypothetical protein